MRGEQIFSTLVSIYDKTWHFPLKNMDFQKRIWIWKWACLSNPNPIPNPFLKKDLKSNQIQQKGFQIRICQIPNQILEYSVI